MLHHYRKLLGLTLNHGYYSDDLCPDFTFVPTTSCKEKLAQYGLLFKANKTGFRIVYRAQEEGGSILPVVPLSDMPLGERFSFVMQLKNPNFLNITDLGGAFTTLGHWMVLFSSDGGVLATDGGVPDTYQFPAFRMIRIRQQDLSYRFTMPGSPSKARLLVRNAQGRTVRSMEVTKDTADNYTAAVWVHQTGPGEYHFTRVDPVTGPVFPAESLYLDKQLLFNGPFGVLELVNESDASGSYWDQVQIHNQNPANERELEYSVDFAHREELWKYTIVFKRTEYSGSPGDYEIRDGLATVISGDRYNTGAPSDKFFFSQPPTATTFDEMDALVFTSQDDSAIDKEYPWYEESKRDLLLAEVDSPGGAIVKRLVRELPNPDPNYSKTEIIVFI